MSSRHVGCCISLLELRSLSSLQKTCHLDPLRQCCLSPVRIISEEIGVDFLTICCESMTQLIQKNSDRVTVIEIYSKREESMAGNLAPPSPQPHPPNPFCNKKVLAGRPNMSTIRPRFAPVNGEGGTCKPEIEFAVPKASFALPSDTTFLKKKSMHLFAIVDHVFLSKGKIFLSLISVSARSSPNTDYPSQDLWQCPWGLPWERPIQWTQQAYGQIWWTVRSNCAEHAKWQRFWKSTSKISNDIICGRVFELFRLKPQKKARSQKRLERRRNQFSRSWAVNGSLWTPFCVLWGWLSHCMIWHRAFSHHRTHLAIVTTHPDVGPARAANHERSYAAISKKTSCLQGGPASSLTKTLSVGFFQKRLLSRWLSRGKQPIEALGGERPTKGTKWRIKEGKRPSKANGWLWPQSWRKASPQKRPIKGSMMLVEKALLRTSPLLLRWRSTFQGHAPVLFLQLGWRHETEWTPPPPPQQQVITTKFPWDFFVASLNGFWDPEISGRGGLVQALRTRTQFSQKAFFSDFCVSFSDRRGGGWLISFLSTTRICGRPIVSDEVARADSPKKMEIQSVRRLSTENIENRFATSEHSPDQVVQSREHKPSKF